MPRKKDPTPKPEGEEYKVGRGRPPKEHQFKAGNRANPGGRPKGPTLEPLLREYLKKNKLLAAKTLIEAMVLQAARGNGAAMKIIFDRIDGPITKKVEHSFDLSKLDDKELDVFEAILAKIASD